VFDQNSSDLTSLKFIKHRKKIKKLYFLKLKFFISDEMN